MIQYWDKPLPPAEVRELMKTWERVNDLHKYQLWSRVDFLDSLDGSPWQPLVIEAFQRCGHPAFESDIVRLVELFRQGGVWADADHEAFAPVERLWSTDTGLVLLQRPNGVMASSLLAAEEGHPFIELVVETMFARFPHIQPGSNLWEVLGPGLITQCAKSFDFSSTDLIIPWMESMQVQRVHNDLAYKTNHWSGIHSLQMQTPNSKTSGD
jgi:mannosyltransferase OCH1-like enzyme